MATAEEILQVRYELADTDPAFPILSDAELTYFIDKNSGSLLRASMDAARATLFKLSLRTDESVDIFSIRGSQSAKAYSDALKLYLKDPTLNPVYNNVTGYAGGISKSDMESNDSNPDNNLPVSAEDDIIVPSNQSYFGV